MTSKKDFEERLQETRSKNKNKIRYRRRVQQADEDEKYLQEELRRVLDDKETNPLR